jgi:hypothetical protein
VLSERSILPAWKANRGRAAGESALAAGQAPESCRRVRVGERPRSNEPVVESVPARASGRS